MKGQSAPPARAVKLGADLPDDFSSLLDALQQRRPLSQDRAARAIDALMTGDIDDARIEQLLLAWAAKGETVDELVGAASVLRRYLTPIACDAPNAIDTCGTGGDGISTFNVSTAAAIVAAAAGATVAKHGNRTHSRASGSAEVLQQLGVNIDASARVVEQCLKHVGIAFLFAPRLHPAVARVAAVRRKIGRQTIFNLIGPLANPASVRRQIVGVPRADLVQPMAEALARLGATCAFVVHGCDGLCDFTITGPSRFVHLKDGALAAGRIAPEDVGRPAATLDSLRVSSAAQSARVILDVLAAKPGPARDHTLLNAGAALVVAGLADTIALGFEKAAAAVDSAAASRTLARLVELSRGPGEDPS